MMNQKEKNEARDLAMEKMAEETTFEGFEFQGRGKDGLIFKTEEGDIMVVKAVMKKENFDWEDDIDAFEEAELKREAKAKEKAEKAAKRKEKEDEDE